jgi:thioesterase domain-containing protein
MASRLGVSLPLALIFQHPRLSAMALQLQHLGSASLPLGMQTSDGSKATLFTFPPLLGLSVYFCLWSKLLEGYALYAFDFADEEALLERYYQEIVSVQPVGPYLLMGYSLGGNLAYELALYMESRGAVVSDLLLLDSGVRTLYDGPPPESVQEMGLQMMENIRQVKDMDEEMKEILVDPQNIDRIVSYHRFMETRPTRGCIHANIHLLMSADDRSEDDGWKQWGQFTQGDFREYQGCGRHADMFIPPWLDDNAATLLQLLDGITTGGHPAISVESSPPPEERLLQLWQEYRELSAELLLLQQHEELRE